MLERYYHGVPIEKQRITRRVQEYLERTLEAYKAKYDLTDNEILAMLEDIERKIKERGQ